jgi:hypothetical protein
VRFLAGRGRLESLETTGGLTAQESRPAAKTAGAMERNVYPQSEDSPQFAIEPRRPSEPAPARPTLPEGAAHLRGHINVPGICNPAGAPVSQSPGPMAPQIGSPRVADKFDKLLLPVGMAGFEPATSCSQISPARSPDVAPRRLMCDSPAVIVAGRRSASPDGCARWLPLWLPRSAARTRLLPIERIFEFRKQDQGAPVPRRPDR